MAKPSVQLVWFKRDLRVRDHRPLYEAAQRGAVLPLYIIEPSLVHAPDFAPSHWTFLQDCLRELRAELAKLGQPLIVRVGETLPVLQSFAEQFHLSIWSHEETSNWLAYRRDQAVRRWRREQNIEYHELPCNGVVRRLKSRDEWAAIWEERMRQPKTPMPKALTPIPGIEPGAIPTHEELGLTPDKRADAIQRGGEIAGRRWLTSFFQVRGVNYQRGLSSPLSAADACSRLSPYLTWGSLSTKQVVQELRENLASATPRWERSLLAFQSRLYWRCHFIQKLEDEPALENQNFVRAYDGLRESEFAPEKFGAWQHGATGFPMIDACMRMLNATGWLNFRMRSMLTAFAAYDLWLHWREPALHLARQFVDYEPGIHYCQMQMQSGTSGHTTIRLYNPTKQAQDHDPNGEFITRWLPELRAVPVAFRHTPWLMSGEQQRKAGCLIGKHYPAPIVDHERAIRHARQRISAFRRNPQLAEEVSAVFQKHGSRRQMPEARKKAAPSNQLRLFDD